MKALSKVSRIASPALIEVFITNRNVRNARTHKFEREKWYSHFHANSFNASRAVTRV